MTVEVDREPATLTFYCNICGKPSLTDVRYLIERPRHARLAIRTRECARSSKLFFQRNFFMRISCYLAFRPAGKYEAWE